MRHLILTKENGVFHLHIKFTNKGKTLVIGIHGELDHHSADYTRLKIDAELMKSTTKNIVFDFSKVSFMDSSGIGVIMGRYKNISKLNGKAAITNVSQQIKRILEMSGVLKIIPAYDSINDAMEHVS